jgi:hypothetical protein
VKFFLSFPPHWGGFISLFTFQLQLQIAILQLLMSAVVFFLAWAMFLIAQMAHIFGCFLHGKNSCVLTLGDFFANPSGYPDVSEYPEAAILSGDSSVSAQRPILNFAPRGKL